MRKEGDKYLPVEVVAVGGKARSPARWAGEGSGGQKGEGKGTGPGKEWAGKCREGQGKSGTDCNKGKELYGRKRSGNGRNGRKGLGRTGNTGGKFAALRSWKQFAGRGRIDKRELSSRGQHKNEWAQGS